MFDFCKGKSANIRKKDAIYFSKHEDVMKKEIAFVKLHNMSKQKYKQSISKICGIDDGNLIKRIISCFK